MSGFFSRLASTVSSAMSGAVAKVAEVTAELSLDSLQVRFSIPPQAVEILVVNMTNLLKAGGVWRSHWTEAIV